MKKSGAWSPADGAGGRRLTRVGYIANRLAGRRSFGHGPRTDVLSATIVEGRSEEELADRSGHAQIFVASFDLFLPHHLCRPHLRTPFGVVTPFGGRDPCNPYTRPE